MFKTPSPLAGEGWGEGLSSCSTLVGLQPNSKPPPLGGAS